MGFALWHCPWRATLWVTADPMPCSWNLPLTGDIIFFFSSGFPHREQTAEPAPPPGEERMLSAEVGRHLLCESHWAGGRETLFSQYYLSLRLHQCRLPGLSGLPITVFLQLWLWCHDLCGAPSLWCHDVRSSLLTLGFCSSVLTTPVHCIFLVLPWSLYLGSKDAGSEELRVWENPMFMACWVRHLSGESCFLLRPWELKVRMTCTSW